MHNIDVVKLAYFKVLFVVNYYREIIFFILLKEYIFISVPLALIAKVCSNAFFS
jgi:hypothetical protein